MSSTTIHLSYATPSLGMHPTHSLPKKLNAIADAGFSSIELGFDDLLSYARERTSNKNLAEDDFDALEKVARDDVAPLCKKLGLEILVLQPFSTFEGYPIESDKRRAAFDKAKGWLRIMNAVGTNMLQVGSTDDKSTTSDRKQIAADLAELADLIAPKKIAYENWCWGAHVKTWKDIWEVVQLANRDNIGLCLDTFQTAGLEWADPTTEEGVQDNANEKFAKSMEDLKKTIPAEKIFFFQISDAYKMDPPMDTKDVDGTPTRGRWSHAARPSPYNGGYLPVRDMVEAVLGTGFRGWFSVEVFDEKEHQKEWEEGQLEGWAKQGIDSVRRLLQECGVGEESMKFLKLN